MSLPNVPPLSKIIGPGAEGGHEFARICHQLLLHTATIEGWTYDMCSDRCGDLRHLDGWSSDGTGFKDGLTGFQFKFFSSPLSSAHRTTIAESRRDAIADNPDMVRWILVLPDDAHANDRDWFGRLDCGHVMTQCWGHTRLQHMLLRYPELCGKYYPQLLNESRHTVQTLKDIEQSRSSQDKINHTVDRYLGMLRSHCDNGVHALLRSGIGGMTSEEFAAVIETIVVQYGEKDPLGDIPDRLNDHGVLTYDFLQWIISHGLADKRYDPFSWNLTLLAEEFKTDKMSSEPALQTS